MKNSTRNKINDLISRYPQLNICYDSIISATEILINTYENDGKLLVCGNGGSSADSEHIVGELMKGFVLKRKLRVDLCEKINDSKLTDSLQYGLPAIALDSHTALTTAFSNDQLPEAVFAQQVLGYVKINDTLLCISTSGNSLNCVYAAKVAKALGMYVVSLTGKKDSKLLELSDITIQAPEEETYKIQELHLPIYHCWCLMLEDHFFGEDK